MERGPQAGRRWLRSCTGFAAAVILVAALEGCPVVRPEQACLHSGGTVSSAMCCASADDFPDTCVIGACGCPPDGSHQVAVCDCGEGRCFNGTECVER